MDRGLQGVKTLVTKNEDRISDLPDHLLCHILSYLTSKESAVTSALSRRWRYVFTAVPVVDLEFYHDLPDYEETLVSCVEKNFLDFITFGYRMVLLQDRAPIRKFRLFLMELSKTSAMAVEALVSAGLSQQIQQLEISIASVDSYDINRLCGVGILTCKTLVSLKLKWWQFAYLELTNSICLPNLKILHIGDVIIADESLVDGEVIIVDDCLVERLIQGCPLLEELKLRYKCLKELFKISNSSLKKLILDCCEKDYGYTVVIESKSLESFDYRDISGDISGERMEKFEINAPNLQYLSYNAQSIALNLIQVPKHLVRAELLMGGFGTADRYTQDAFELLHSVKHVKSLRLTENILEALFGFERSLPNFENLTRLELDFIYDWDKLPGIAESVPNLESLILGKVYWDFDLKRFELPRLLPKRFIKQLKEIEIAELYGNACELKLVQYVLKNGKSLKKMTLGGSRKPSTNKRITSFKRCSKHCQVVLEETRNMLFHWR